MHHCDLARARNFSGRENPTKQLVDDSPSIVEYAMIIQSSASHNPWLTYSATIIAGQEFCSANFSIMLKPAILHRHLVDRVKPLTKNTIDRVKFCHVQFSCVRFFKRMCKRICQELHALLLFSQFFKILTPRFVCPCTYLG